MKSTFPSPGDDGLAVIPPLSPQGVESSWGSDFGINTPQGGLVSTINDMAKFVRAILAHDARILSSVEVDAWLKPRSFTSSATFAYGAPWEIYRVPPGTWEGIDVTTDVYAKDGGVVGYSSRTILVPQYGLGIVVLTAGPTGYIVDAISEAVVAAMVPAFDQAARAQARTSHAGVYEGTSSTMGESVPMNFTVGVDEGPGLRVRELFRNGTDILESLRLIQQSGIVVASGLAEDWRLYPSSYEDLRTENVTIPLQNSGTGEEVQVDVQEWRITALPTPLVSEEEKSNTPLLRVGKNVFADSVSSWMFVDGVYYGGEAVDRVECLRRKVEGGGGEVVGWRFPALRGEVWRT
jgi:hypothetical protein